MSISKVLRKGLSALLVGAMAFSFSTMVSAAEKHPDIMITRMIPNSDNKPSATGSSVDAWELIEIYNTTANSINLKGYYVTVPESKKGQCPLEGTIASRDFKYLWVKVDLQDTVTKEDFAKQMEKFKGDKVIKASDVVEIHKDCGLHNTATRTINLYDAKDTLISSVVYNDNETKDELNAANASGVYGIADKGGPVLKKIGKEVPIEPGKIYPGQFPPVAQASAPAAKPATPAASTPAPAAKPATPAASAPAAQKPAATPAAMPKTGMGGTQQAESSNLLNWALAALATASVATVFVTRKKAKQK